MFADQTAIYSHKHVGTFEVNGAIKKRWTALGGVASGLATRRGRVRHEHRKRRSDFQHGDIVWNPKTGKTTVKHG